MPIYDYRCKDCNTVYDVYHKVKEIVDDIICPSCGSKNYIKLISAPSISFSSSTSVSSTNHTPCDSGCCGGTCGFN